MILEEISQLPGYELIDTGTGFRLECFGDYVLQRPDPQILWKRALMRSAWDAADAVFIKEGDDENERGGWKISGQNLPKKWMMHYEIPQSKDRINFYVSLTPFKHTGVFPEQVANWNFIVEHLSGGDSRAARGIKFLNLFGYTGIASVLAAKLGANVTHVDASKPSITWAKENMLASGLPDDAIRWIFDDCLKFVKREAKRGNKYDAIILDPPAFGRGPKGEVWKFNEHLPALFEELAKIASADFRFMIVNAYAVSVSSLLLENMLRDFAEAVGFGAGASGTSGALPIVAGELVLKDKSGRPLSTGIFGRLG